MGVRRMAEGKTKTTKKCRRCKDVKPKELFVDTSGAPNPRGAYCRDCHAIREQEWRQAAIAEKGETHRP